MVEGGIFCLCKLLEIEKKAEMDIFALIYLVGSIKVLNPLSSLVGMLALQLHLQIMFENCVRGNIHILLDGRKHFLLKC